MPKGKKASSTGNSKIPKWLGLMGLSDKEDLTAGLSAICQGLSEQEEEQKRCTEALKESIAGLEKSIAAFEKASRSSSKALGEALKGIVQIQSEEIATMERIHTEVLKTRKDIGEVKKALTYLGKDVATSKDMALVEELMRLLVANHLIERV